MKHSMRIFGVVLGVTLALAPVSALAGEPTDQLKDTIETVLAILNNPDIKDAERRKLIRQAADNRFHWNDMARSAMGIHWRDRSPKEKKEFTRLFTNLVESVYLDKIESYSGEKIRCLGDSTSHGYGTVKVAIISQKGTETPITYRVMEEKGKWLIHDVCIDGVSLVYNYRSQFGHILTNSSYEELVRRLKKNLYRTESVDGNKAFQGALKMDTSALSLLSWLWQSPLGHGSSGGKIPRH